MTARVYRSLTEVGRDFGPCALTIGNFDGVHAGHQHLLRKVIATARANGWKAAAMLFDPHPTKVVAPDRAPKLLTTPEQRCELMAAVGIEEILILPFSRAFSELSPEEFVSQVVAGKLGARAVLVGDNFRFGNRQSGDTETLQALGRKYGYQTEIVPAIRLRGRVVSSSEVRRLIQSGQVSLAARLLGRPYSLEGSIVSGQGIGSRQTVPTLNLSTDAELLPATGVYVTETYDLDHERHWPSVTNVGYRPTFNGTSLTIETFLLESLTGDAPRRIRLSFCRRLREERKFASPQELKSQIMRDVTRARSYFRRRERWTSPEPAFTSESDVDV